MSCLKNYLRPTLSRQLLYKPAFCPRAPPPLQEPTYRHYHASSRRPDQALQSIRGGLFRRFPISCNRPPPAQAQLRRHYSKRLSDVVRFTPRRGGPEWYQDKRVIKAAFYVSGCAVITLWCGKFETVPYSNRTHFIVLPPSVERWLGKTVFARFKHQLASKILPPEHPDSVRVRKLVMEIVRAAERGLAAPQAELSSQLDEELWKKGARGARPQTRHIDGLDWEVIVVKDKLVNAMCAPGGKIIVYTGLLDQMKMDAEVATVLGHEVGHAIARHTAENITKLLWFVILKIVFLQFIDMGGEDLWIDRMWKLLFQLPFSRRMEMEADHIGIMLLAAAGFDPRIAPTVYEKLGKITGSDSDLKNYTSTHPSSKKRSQLLSQDKVMQEAMEIYRKALADKQNNGFFSSFFKG